MEKKDHHQNLLDQKKKRALLISGYKDTHEKNLHDEYLDELAALTDTFGAEVADKVNCHLRKFEASTFLTSGKLEELVLKAQELAVDFVILDNEISPAQQRNLEKEFKITVMDRTELIIEVFAQRAQTKEARLQIELARVRYFSPRLKRMWTHLERQAAPGSSGGYLKGPGEKQIELDRRILQRRLDLLKKELEEVKASRETQRGLRERTGIPVFAIIGYTNAGKSTLLNALTDAQVFVEDKLFATLDTTTRKFTLPNNQEILLIDTVGFIRKLPHQLIAAFKSTLEESIHADILLHLVDVSNPSAEEHAVATYQVLRQLGAEEKAIITVFNKIDECQDKAILHRLKLKYPKTISISALKKTGFDELLARMVDELSAQRSVVTLRIPQSAYNTVSEVMRVGHVTNKEYDENDVILKVELPAALVSKLKSYII